MTCGHCGLVLTDARAPQLLVLGRQMVALEKQRQLLIGEILSAHRAPPAPSPATVAVAPVVEVALPTPAVSMTAAPPSAVAHLPEPTLSWAAETPTASAPVVPAKPPKPPKPAKPPRKRLTVPVLLLIVGVTLVGVAAIFFLVLAWNNADIGVKSIIIAGVTLTTMAAASVLRRFSLKATAEGIGALGVILLALDAWAVRLNDLFGAADLKPALYAGLAALVVGVLCRVWSLISRLRGPDLAATLAIPTGLGLLIAGLVPLETSGAITAGLIAASVGGLAHALPSPWSAARSRQDSVVERSALAAIGVAALIGASAMLAFGLESLTVQLVAAIAVVAVGAAHLLVLRARGDADAVAGAFPLAATAGAISAAVAASIGWQLAGRDALPVYSQLLAPVIAVAVAVAMDRWMLRDRTLIAARIASAVVAGLIVAAVLIADLMRAQAAAMTWYLWTTPATSVPEAVDVPAVAMAALAAAIVAVLLFLAPTLDRPGLRQARPVVGQVLLVTAAVGTGIPILAAGVAIATSAIGLVGLRRAGMRVGWGAVAGIGASTAFAVGLTSPWLWALGALVALAVPIIARAILPADARIGVPLALAPVAIGALIALIAPAAISTWLGVPVDARAALVLIEWVALASLAAAVILRLDALSRTAVALSSYLLLAGSLTQFVWPPASAPSVSASLGEPALSIVRACLLALLLAVVAIRRTRVGGGPSLGAALLLPPVVASIGIGALEVAGVDRPGPIALTVTAIATVLVWLGALLPRRTFGAAGDVVDATPDPEVPRTAADAIRERYPRFARIAVDVGSLLCLVAIVPLAPADVRWAVLALVALLFAGTAVTRGWAAPAGAFTSDVPHIRSEGVPLPAAPRRLMAWPAFGIATFSLWAWLADAGSYEIEAYALPPAVGLLLFAAVLVWLRREPEASAAVTLSFGLGLVLPATAALTGSAVRGTVVAIVAAVVAVGFAWTPVRRVRFPALAGTLVALVALTIVALDRGLDAPASPAWLLLLVAAAYAAAFGFMRTPAARQPLRQGSPAEAWFAAFAPPIILAIACAALLRSLDQPLVVTVALILLGALHLVSAGLHALPLATATRWTALAGAVTIAAGAYSWQDLGAIEIVSLPIALMVLGAAALAMWRRARSGLQWPGSERGVWLAGLVVAVAPSVAVEPTDVRTWLVIAGTLLAAVECIVVPLPDALRLKAPSAFLLSAGALAMGARALLDPALGSSELAAVVAGTGAFAIAAIMVWRSETDAARWPTTVLAAAGAALTIAAVFDHADGELMRTALTAVIAGIVGVGGALLLRWARWAPLGAVLAIAGVVAALLAVGARFALVATTPSPGIEPDVWAVAGTGIVVAVGIAALRSSASRIVALVVSATFSVALVLFTGAELLLLGSTHADELRTVLTVSALTVVGVVAFMRRAQLGLSLAVTAAALTVVFALVALVAFGVRPFELVTLPPAVGLVFLGARAMRRDSAVRSWRALGPGLVLLTIPSLVYDFTVPSLVDEFPSLDDDSSVALWRAVGLGLIAIGMVVAGAVWRLQAPLVLGSAVLLVHAVAQLWPWISDLYVAVPWWLWLGVGGALLIFLAARYEKRMRELRAAFTAISSLR
jgi:hypothetical protein